MKRHLLAFVLGALVLAGAESQEYYLQNQTSSTLYLLAEPVPPIPTDVRFGPNAAYRQVPAGGLVPIPRTGAIAGFAFTRRSFRLPTFLVAEDGREQLTRIAESGRRYLVVDDSMLTTTRIVLSSEFADVLSRPRIDNQYLDWVPRDARIARARGRAPLGVYADFGDGREPTSIESSLLWARGGTDLQWIKTAIDERDVYVAASVYSAFARSTAVFVYLYGANEEVPRATLELPAGGPSGLVLLWRPTAAEPVVAGNLASNDFFLEAQIWREVLDAALGSYGTGLIVEISTASSAAGIWEEFVLARDEFEVVFSE